MGSGNNKRNQAMAMRAAKMAAYGYTTKDIAVAIGKRPEQVKAIVKLGERLISATSTRNDHG